METINSIFDKFEEPKLKPLNYIRKSALKSSNTQELIADVFKLMQNRSQGAKGRRNETLQEIFIQNFDSEQIWQQLELKNKTLKSYIPQITKLLLNKADVSFPYAKESDLAESSQVDDSNKGVLTVENDEETSSDESEDSPNDEDIAGKTEDIEIEKDEEEEKAAQPMYKDFFEDPSRKKNPRNEQQNEDSSLSDENDEDVDDEDEVNDLKKRSKRSKKDFDETNNSKKVRFMSDDGSDSEESEVDVKSSFEKKNSKLKEQIAKLEEKALSKKPWPQKGEVDAQQRPFNSLLEEIVDVDLTTRPAPIMTEKVMLDLESIILKRIKDRAFDDVEKKIKPVHVQHELKKELVLNQEKSKLSLAQVYEQEYLSKQDVNNDHETADNNEMTEQKEEILKMMKSVFKKLDTLSNFHYTPKPVTEELKIISNAPAITLEEAIPMAVSESNTLAPQEISGSKKKNLIGKDERTKTDKLRERRKKKAFLSKKLKRSIFKTIKPT